MFKLQNKKQNWLVACALVALCSLSSHAQYLPTDAETERLSDAIAQTNGDFASVNLNYLQSLGMQQKAWNDPLAHMGEGQSKPGYSRYSWTPDAILPVRLREGMMTLINLPAWELIEKVHIGSPESFGGEIAAPNSLLIYADPQYIGVDSNMIIFGRSGNRYVFYLRSETYNTSKITQSVVDILVGPRYTPVENGGRVNNPNGTTNTASQRGSLSGNTSPGWAMGRSGGQNPQIGINTASSGPNNWLQHIPVDPENLRFDIDMYIPNPEDVDIAPDNIWRDNIFTYIDLGPKSLTMTQRPIVNLLVQDSEVPVGFRTTGPNGRLIVVEGIGDMVLRNGKKLICLKLRRDPSSGLEHIDYSGSKMAASSTAKPTVMSQEPLPVISPMNQQPQNQQYANHPSNPTQNGYNYAYANERNNNQGYFANQNYMQGENNVQANPNYAQQPNASIYTQNMQPMNNIPSNIMNSPNASAGIVGVMSQMPINRPSNYAPVNAETISIELATHGDITELESTWESLYAKNTDVLKGYEPYYSVDTTADGNMRDLFRLRVGPIKNVQIADKMCKKLGRRGFGCAVVRVQ